MARVSELKVKGSVLRSRLAFVEEQAGKDGVQRVLVGLAPHERTALQSVLASSWYPFELGSHLDDAIVRVLGRGRQEYFETLGEASAVRNLSGVHKDFVTPLDPRAFLERTPVIYSLYYDKGRREVQFTGPSEAVLTTYDAETFSVPDCLTVVGWHRKALEMCGASGVRVVEEECRARGGRFCRYRVSWLPPQRP
jgi:uncharacterized protein (TIGR02265 family)